MIRYQGYKGRLLDGTKPWDSSDGLCPFRELEIQWSRDTGGWVEWNHWTEKGEGLSVPFYPAYRVLLPCLSPGPARDMQPTMTLDATAKVRRHAGFPRGNTEGPGTTSSEPLLPS